LELRDPSQSDRKKEKGIGSKNQGPVGALQTWRGKGIGGMGDEVRGVSGGGKVGNVVLVSLEKRDGEVLPFFT